MLAPVHFASHLLEKFQSFACATRTDLMVENFLKIFGTHSFAWGIDCDARQKRATSELLTLGVGSVWRTTPARSTRRRLGLAECAVSARADRDRADVGGAKTRRRRPVTSRDRDHGEFVAR